MKEKKAPSRTSEPKHRSSIKIEQAVRKTVDENHLFVRKCVLAGHSEERSVDAVAKCGSLEDALVYLERANPDEEDEEDELFPTSFRRHLSWEESPGDSFKMYDK